MFIFLIFIGAVPGKVWLAGDKKIQQICSDNYTARSFQLPGRFRVVAWMMISDSPMLHQFCLVR